MIFQRMGKGIFLKYILGGNRNSLFITEDAMYDVLMMSSHKKEAKPFRREIKLYLKQIRLTGVQVTWASISNNTGESFGFDTQIWEEPIRELIDNGKLVTIFKKHAKARGLNLR